MLKWKHNLPSLQLPSVSFSKDKRVFPHYENCLFSMFFLCLFKDSTIFWILENTIRCHLPSVEILSVRSKSKDGRNNLKYILLASGYFMEGCRMAVVLSQLLQQKLNYLPKDNCVVLHSLSESSIFFGSRIAATISFTDVIFLSPKLFADLKLLLG